MLLHLVLDLSWWPVHIMSTLRTSDNGISGQKWCIVATHLQHDSINNPYHFAAIWLSILGMRDLTGFHHIVKEIHQLLYVHKNENPFNIIGKSINAHGVPSLVKIGQKLWPGSPKGSSRA